MLEGSNIHCIAPCLVTAKEVKQVLSCLDPNKDCGPYNIPSSMLKHYRFFISEPLVVLKNYRQVIILSALTKTFKKLVSLRISPLIKNIISPKFPRSFSEEFYGSSCVPIELGSGTFLPLGNQSRPTSFVLQPKLRFLHKFPALLTVATYRIAWLL
ncbi:hypothetical protein J6590_079863 [Homalodisca vitripennis]|nr:hypothetical protein J6590_079863 [Homalodisca vitripennis]